MARTRNRKSDPHTADSPADEAADIATANDPSDPFGEAIQAAQADDLARRQQDAQQRDAAKSAHHDANGHAEEPSLSVQAETVNGQAVGAERPRPRSTEVITDAAAKMRLHSNHHTYKMAITFDDGKPSEEVRQTLKDAGFRWDGQGAWEKPTSYDTRVRDRIDAERVFDAVADMRKQEAGTAIAR
ncbi:MAG: hypothetical protein ACRC33_04935 [Gemmataceae bacterium]